MKYVEPRLGSPADAREALEQFDLEAASELIIGMALHSPQEYEAEQLCIEAAASPHPIVRGNAILGFGHLARRFGRLNRSLVEPLVVAALKDTDMYVRGHAHSAADDIEQFLGWAARA